MIQNLCNVNNIVKKLSKVIFSKIIDVTYSKPLPDYTHFLCPLCLQFCSAHSHTYNVSCHWSRPKSVQSYFFCDSKPLSCQQCWQKTGEYIVILTKIIGVIQNLYQIKHDFYVHCVFSSAQHTVIHTTCHVTDLVQKLESPDAGLTVPHWSIWSNIVQKLESFF